MTENTRLITAEKYTLWRRSIILGFLLSIYLGYTKGGLYGWVPALLSLYSTAHFLDSYAQYPKGIYARVFLVLTRLQRLLDAEEWVLSPFRGPARAA